MQCFTEPPLYEHLRFDHALENGAVVTPHYDAMLGKLIAHAPTRAEAIDRLAQALDDTVLLGLPNNRAFLAACLRHPTFRAGRGRPFPFLGSTHDAVRAALAPSRESLVAAALAASYLGHGSGTLPSPFPRPLRWRHGEQTLDLVVREKGHGALLVAVGADTHDAVVGDGVVTLDGVSHRATVSHLPDGRHEVRWGVDQVTLDDQSHTAPASAGGGVACARAARPVQRQAGRAVGAARPACGARPGAADHRKHEDRTPDQCAARRHRVGRDCGRGPAADAGAGAPGLCGRGRMNTPSTDIPATFDSADLQALVDTVRRFATEQVRPHVDEWDAAGEFPRALYRQAAALGLLGLGYPEHLGGTPVPWRARNALSQTLARFGTSGGVMASLFSLNIGLPPVLAHGSPELQAEVIPPALRGEQHRRARHHRTRRRLRRGQPALHRAPRRRRLRDSMAKKCSSPPACAPTGSHSPCSTDLQQQRRQRHQHDRGAGQHAAGLSRSPLQKMGWHCSDTAHLRFDGVRVPVRYLLAQEGAGFRIIMGNFNGERLAMSAMALGFAQACYDEALDWARQRQTFGAPLIERQVIRHKLMDMQMRIASTQAWVDALTARVDGGRREPGLGRERVPAEEPFATQTMQFCADAAVQILGGMGYMRGTASERIYREVKVMMIGGGAEEIMKELAARQLGV